MTGISDTTARRRYEALATLMGKLAELHDALAIVLRGKLEAMSRADLDAMRTESLREQALASEISERDGLRRQLMQQIGKGLGMSADVARCMRVKKLADRLSPPHRGRLIAAADRLKHSVVAARRVNVIVQSVSELTLQHIREVFASLSTSDDPPAGGYTRRGETASSPARELFEAIG